MKLRKKLSLILLLSVILVVAYIVSTSFRLNIDSDKIELASVNNATVAEPGDDPEIKELEVVTPTLTIEGSGVEVLGTGEHAWVPGVDGQEVTQGSKIRTNAESTASVNYPSGTVTRLDASTEITLDELVMSPQQINIVILQGRVWSSVFKLLGGESYQTESEGSVASVRGTAYSHEVLPDGTADVVVAESTVKVGCKAQEADETSQDVTEGSTGEANCRAGKKQVLLRKTEAATKLRKWFTDNQNKDKTRKALKQKVEERKKLRKFDINIPNFLKRRTPSPTPTPNIRLRNQRNRTGAPTSTPSSTLVPEPSTVPDLNPESLPGL